MKKTYQQPHTTITIIHGAKAFMGILSGNANVDISSDNAIDAGSEWVKSNRSDYNVWNDDWSE